MSEKAWKWSSITGVAPELVGGGGTKIYKFRCGGFRHITFPYYHIILGESGPKRPL